MIYMLVTFGGRKNVKQRESKKIKERRIKGRERGPGLLIQSLHEKKKALETREGAKKRKREIIDRKLIHVEEIRGLRF